jgi:maleate isomerase
MILPSKQEVGYGGGPAIGLIVLSTDETLEPEFRQIKTQPATSLYHSRIAFEPVVTKATLARMELALPACVDLFSNHIDFNAIGYGCTSGATIIGSERIAQIINERFPGAAVTDPINAVKAACEALGVVRLGLLTPYSIEVSSSMQRLLEAQGIEISGFATFNETQDHRVARIAESSILDGMLELGKGDCDAVFASCTSLRCFNVIEQAETILGKPVFSSNSAFAWHLHTLAGISGEIQGPGQLFRY